MHKIELNIRDLLDLLTNREVTKGNIKFRIDPLFFMGVLNINTVRKNIHDLLVGERL